MFFFFVGGVEEAAGRVLKEAAGRCLRCGGAADLVEAQKVLKIFFVPVWRWNSNNRAFSCRNCGLLWPDSFPAIPGAAERDAIELAAPPRCFACAREVDPSFRFCPFCGAAL